MGQFSHVAPSLILECSRNEVVSQTVTLTVGPEKGSAKIQNLNARSLEMGKAISD